MPRKIEIDALHAELESVVSMLSEAEKYADAIGILQYSRKKEEIESRLQEVAAGDSHLASVALFFGGKPVFGSRGIAADFAGKALRDFQDIISKQFSTSEVGDLGERGVVAYRPHSELMVTGVTQGSFGFVLDELSDQTRLFDTSLKEIVTQVMQIMESAGGPNEDEYDTMIEQIHPRALASLKDFFLHIDKSEATIRLVDDERDYPFDDRAVHRARVRLEATDITEEDLEIDGVITGLLPEHRRFEMSIPGGESIWGTMTPEAVEHYLEASGGERPVLNTKCRIAVVARKVAPLGRKPRTVYRLLRFITIATDEAS
jgi:hypothetical protein